MPPGDSGWDALRVFLHRLFVRLGAQTHDADDLAQESLARVVGRPESKSAPPSLGFAAVVGRNLWRDGIRRDRRRGPQHAIEAAGDVADPQATPQELAAGREDSGLLFAALDRLDERHREAITLVVLRHKSYAEAARILGVPRGTVKSRIHYGIERLRALMGAPAPSEVHDRSRPC
jgi:RNA polymerase sigma-70 factor (ECF subfamily)